MNKHFMTFAPNKLFNYCIVIIFGISIGYFGNHYLSTLGINIPINPSTQKELLEKEIFSSEKIKKTIKLIQDYSYGFDKKSKEEIEDAMLKSIVNSLGDKHSTYLTRKETTEFEEALRGDFEGIGAVINEHPKGIKIMKVIVNSPAEKAGLKAGDIMTRVGDISIVNKSVEDAVKVIRGPKGSKAEITFRRGDDNADLFVTVLRDKVSVPSVAEKMLEKKIGYIEIATFGEHTTNEFIKSWNNLILSGAVGIILDFRNNGGGYLDTAVDLASIVLPNKSSVVIIKQNDIRKNEILFTKTDVKNNTHIPIVVLINDYSASASEIFAGALQDNNRALIIGEKSYGKGSVQEPFDLGDGSIIKITTAGWYTPKDTSIDKIGIIPDIKIFLTQKDYDNVFDRQLKGAEIIIQDQLTFTGTLQDLKDKYQNNTFSSLNN